MQPHRIHDDNQFLLRTTPAPQTYVFRVGPDNLTAARQYAQTLWGRRNSCHRHGCLFPFSSLGITAVASRPPNVGWSVGTQGSSFSQATESSHQYNVLYSIYRTYAGEDCRVTNPLQR